MGWGKSRPDPGRKFQAGGAALPRCPVNDSSAPCEPLGHPVRDGRGGREKQSSEERVADRFALALTSPACTGPKGPSLLHHPLLCL